MEKLIACPLRRPWLEVSLGSGTTVMTAGLAMLIVTVPVAGVPARA